MKMRFAVLCLVASLLGAACARELVPDKSILDTTAVPSDVAVSPAGGVATVDPENRPANASSSAPRPMLPNLGPAPAWSNEVWINSDRPLKLEDLRGKVVLLEFWTFG
jgi:hypothetical protein